MHSVALAINRFHRLLAAEDGLVRKLYALLQPEPSC